MSETKWLDFVAGFRPEQQFAINRTTTSAVVGDVNGNNKPDIVVGAGGIVVLLQR